MQTACLASMPDTSKQLLQLAHYLPGSCASSLCCWHALEGDLVATAKALTLTPQQLCHKLLRPLLGLRLLRQPHGRLRQKQIMAAEWFLQARLYGQSAVTTPEPCRQEIALLEDCWQHLLDRKTLPCLLQQVITGRNWQWQLQCRLIPLWYFWSKERATMTSP